jgi:transcriptional regulator with XRE-family HTH domain/tetratricopeptide (TPR) repeat protein
MNLPRFVEQHADRDKSHGRRNNHDVVRTDRPSGFGEELRRHRLSAALTQEELARAAGMSARGIADLERGVRRFPYPDTVDRLATALGLDESDRATLVSLRRRGLHVDQPGTATLPLVGRRLEWRELQGAWQGAIASGPRCVVLEGEAGIGKSHLAQELLSWVERKGFGAAQARAYAAEGRLSYAPVTDWLRSAALHDSVAGLDARSLGHLAQLVPELLIYRPDLAEHTELSDLHHRELFFRSLARAVLSMEQPLLLVLDDLQWCDQDTLEWLHYLLRFDARAPLLLVGTARMEEVVPGHPLAILLSALRASEQLIELQVGPLNAADTAELAVRVAGRMLEPDATRQLFAETEGQPLFVVETVRGWASAAIDSLADVQRADVGGPGPLPPRVHAVISARLGRLSDSARDIVRLAATIGRSFTLDLLVEASASDIDRVVAAIDELWQHQIVREHGSSAYDFSHDRIREVAYTDMSVARRFLLHRRVARALERTAGNDASVSAQVAAHYEQGGLPAQAIPHYRRAAELAQRVHAYYEACHLLRRGLGLLAGLAPARERDLQELAMQTALGPSLVATTGYGARAAVESYFRAQELCEQLEQPQSPPVLRALAIASISHAQFDQAQAFGDQLVRLAQERNDPVLQVEGNYVLGAALFWKGALVSSRKHFEQALGGDLSGFVRNHLSLYTQDPRVVCAIRLALDLWLLGYPDHAHAKRTEALQLAREAAHPFSLAYVLSYSVWLAVLERNASVALEHGEAGIALCREHGMDVWLGFLSIGRGWAIAEGGDPHAGISLIHEGVAEYVATDSACMLPLHMGLLAEQYGKVTQTDLGLSTVSDALASVERTGERWYEAELYRCRGGLLELRGEFEDAEVAYQQAVVVARHQNARGLELRAGRSLSSMRERRRSV